MHKKDLIIIGASGHGKVIADIALLQGKYQHIFFLDDDDSRTTCMGMPILGPCSRAEEFWDKAEFFVAIGNSVTRKRIMCDLLEKGACIATLIHPDAVLGSGVKIGIGTVVMAGTVINAEAVIGKGCIVNTCASVDHDCVIGDYVHVSVGAHLAGTVIIKNDVWLGAGVTVSNNLCVCENCMIGTGAVVVKNIEEAGTYVGVPAYRIKNYKKRIEISGGTLTDSSKVMLLYKESRRAS